MADITSRDFQELIKRQKETTDSLQTIIQQNEKAGTPRERFLDNAAEILNDSRLADIRERFDKKEGTTEVDEKVEETDLIEKPIESETADEVAIEETETSIVEESEPIASRTENFFISSGLVCMIQYWIPQVAFFVLF